MIQLFFLFFARNVFFIIRGPAARFPHPTSSPASPGAGARWGSPARVTPRCDYGEKRIYRLTNVSK